MPTIIAGDAEGGVVRTGELIGTRYRLEERIGSGGMGVVWRASDEELDRVVAVKRALSADGVRDAGRARQVRREAKLVARVDHPNVVTLYDLVNHDNELWLVMEYVPARSLAGRGTLPPDQVARIGAQLAGALEAVHAAGVVHRDVKPSNVLVTEDGRAKLSDFGISRADHGDVTLTGSGAIAGTPGYLAPEVANGLDATPASDVFSLGATLFAAVEGVSPVGTADNPLVLVRRAANGDIATARRGGALAPVLSALLHPNPAKRPDATRARKMFEDVVVHPQRQDRRVPVVAGAVLAAIAVLMGLTAASAPTGSPPASPPEAFTIGDPRTADPCALANPAELARFGEAGRDAGHGNFNQCYVLVRTHTGVDVDVIVQLDPATTSRIFPGKTEKHGPLTVVRHLPADDECSRTILLVDRTHVVLRAREEQPESTDLCAIADTATSRALAVLSNGVFPQRAHPADTASLARVDACSLVDNATLSQFPGIDARRPEIGFGDWECRWKSTTIPATLLVVFDRGGTLTTDDGRPTRFGGREAFIKAGGYGARSCVARIVHRPFANADTTRGFELLLVVVLGPLPSDELCRLVTGIAGPAAANLPAT